MDGVMGRPFPWFARYSFACRAVPSLLLCAGFLSSFLPLQAAPADPFVAGITAARDAQDLPALDRFIAQLKGAPANGETAYKAAIANSYAAEVATEMHDKRKAQSYAEAGMSEAQKAVAANGNSAEYHRILGATCGQVIPANPFLGALKYGQCARDEIQKAITLDNKLALAYVSRGVGNYYLPSAMGGGIDPALQDLDHAIALDPKLAEAYLWKGIALRKANRETEAHDALQHAVQLDPNRLWTKQQLAKTSPK
jgi:tetratricopeptide (TPR) repeat protein